MSVEGLPKSEWLNGPAWLKQPVEGWPVLKLEAETDTLEQAFENEVFLSATEKNKWIGSVSAPSSSCETQLPTVVIVSSSRIDREA